MTGRYGEELIQVISILDLVAKIEYNICSHQFDIWYVLYLRTIYYIDFWNRKMQQELDLSAPCIAVSLGMVLSFRDI